MPTSCFTPTRSAGLHENDFIMAAKVNELYTDEYSVV
ncbi:MAG: hypothetical protein R3F36_17215 [Candidatus Competibacteraceae bacterium]